MRGIVLGGMHGACWQPGPRSAAELMEAATHYDRAVPLCPAPAGKAEFAELAVFYRSKALE